MVLVSETRECEECGEEKICYIRGDSVWLCSKCRWG